MRSLLSTKRAGETGVTLVESCLILLLFLFLLLGIVECGRVLNAYHFLANASRQAARFAIVRGGDSGRAVDDAAVTAYVKSIAPGMDPNAFTVTTTWDPDNEPGSAVRVNIQYAFQPVVPFIPPVTMSSASQMTIQY